MRNTFRVFAYCAIALCLAGYVAFLALDASFPFPDRALRADPAVMVRARDGTPMRIFLPEDGRRRFPLALQDVSPVFQKVIIASEDRYFRYHPGVNPFSILRAALQNLQADGVVSGGSTITMQLARLAEPKSRSIKGKIVEAFRALQLEYGLSKDEILKLYLNNTPYGGNVVGVGAAAYTYFGKSAGALSLGEAALLAVLPRSPQAYDPIAHPKAAQAARDRLLDTLEERGVFPPDRVALAKVQPLPTRLTPPPMIAPHASRMAYEQLKRSALARSPKLSVWDVTTTIDPAFQNQALTAMRRRLTSLRLAGLENAAVVVLDRKTREIRALVGTHDFFDTARHGPINAALAMRSPGSTLKPFLYGLAFDEGIAVPESMVLDIPTDYSGYVATNYDDRYRGPVTVRQALVHSLNAPAVRMLAKAGLPRFHRLLRQGGLELRYGPGHYGLPLALGACESSLVQLTTLYAALADEGVWQSARLLADQSEPLEINRKETSIQNDGSVRLLSRESAYLVRSILEEVPRRDLPTAWAMTLDAPEVAWKTGTSFGHRDAWAIGFSAHYVVGVWTGNLDGRAAKGISGARHAGPLLFDVLRAVEEPGAPLPMPDNLALDTVEVCTEDRELPNPFTPRTMAITVIAGRTKLKRSTLHQRIFVNPDTELRVEGRCLATIKAEPRVVRTPPEELIAWELSRGIPVQTAPPLSPECSAVPATGGPAIVSPSATTPYVLRSDAPDEFQRIPLVARTDGGDSNLYWFQDGALVAQGGVAENLFLAARKGEHRIVVQDSQGRSDSLTFTVE
ncbi:penicillin-binding protein 1C [Oceanidesulfovibrio marinus]|uniref:peptidoglycan glycosyltransferase n=1 Tax=Oceanidesulfovibrio marinus TaxID=370038 RepID=A0ABX6ND14_9BACT|nr:penicillin-binding protein 1C [Oceanidesulfovibrio marinus]